MFDWKEFKQEAERLLEATKGCRDDMHEPDEQDLTARVDGKRLDNAGLADEMHVVLWKVTQNVETRHNLASLIALARLGAKQVIEKAKEETPRPGSVAALRKWLEPKNGDDSIQLREVLATRGHDYKVLPLPEFPTMGATIYIERDYSMDRPPRKIVGRKVVG